MNRYEKICETVHDIYVEMYKQATPSADFDKLVSEFSGKIFFDKYILPEEKQEQIIDNICKKNKITGHYKKIVVRTIWLGCSPMSN